LQTQHEFVQNRSFQPEITTFCHFRTWYNHFLTVFSKVHEFVQNSEFSPTSARFVISALGEPLFSHFYESAPVCAKQCFERDDQHVFSF